MEPEVAKQTNAKKSTYHSAVGRRKEAVARVRLFTGNGLLTVNSQPINEYFKGSINQKIYNKPFEVSKAAGLTGSVLVEGGGSMSQLGAVTHGIARALCVANISYRDSLKKAGLLTRDPRAKERRKYGLAQKARAKKQSPKR